jgi:hypothetical protein
MTIYFSFPFHKTEKILWLNTAASYKLLHNAFPDS